MSVYYSLPHWIGTTRTIKMPLLGCNIKRMWADLLKTMCKWKGIFD